MESPTARDIYIVQTKRKMTSYIAREKEPLSKLVKFIKTRCEKKGIPLQDLQKILTEIKRESVEPFLDRSKKSYQPERLTRYENLCKELGVKVN